MKISKKYSMLLFPLLFLAALLAFFILIIQTAYFDSKPSVSEPPRTAAYLDSSLSIEARVADLLSYMTLEEKIGQMALVEKNSIKNVDDIGDYSLGALLSGSGAKPEENSVAGWKQMTSSYQAAAGASRLRIPLFYGSDAIHGHAHVPDGTVFPHMIGLGAAGNPELVKEIAAATADQMRATGVNWNFAPNLDTPRDIRWGRVYETFSDDPALVSQLGAAYVEGLQAGSVDSYKVLATSKHFVGLGGMGWNTSLNKDFKIDQGVTIASEALLHEVYLPPFIAAIDAGALSVMAGLNTWDDARMVRQKYLLTDVLKKQLGFKGFVVSDWYGVHEGTRNTFLATVAAVNAGIDMVMLPFAYEEFIRHMKWANRLGLVSDERIDEAVSRILYAKFSAGLFDTNVQETTLSVNGNEAQRTLAREAVAASLVLLKNDANVLPLKTTTKKIRVAGSAANNVGTQMGAWSIEWQGVSTTSLPNATSILAGITEVANQGTKIEYDLAGEFSTESPKAEVGIAVVGELPYAEGWGDTAYPRLSETDLAAIKNLQQTSEAVVVIIVTGRPLLITEESADWDTLVVAWLPGSEGAGVADVLFGRKRFTGTLPLPWLAHAEQLPISPTGVTSDSTKVLFPRYFGL